MIKVSATKLLGGVMSSGASSASAIAIALGIDSDELSAFLEGSSPPTASQYAHLEKLIAAYEVAIKVVNARALAERLDRLPPVN